MAIVCIKIGGSIIDAKGLLQELAEGLQRLIKRCHRPVIIHGGGKDIARNLNKLNKEFSFVEGHRVTDDETMETVQMVLSGDVNKRIVNALITAGVSAFGMSGVDGGIFTAEKLIINKQDIGYVGTITRVNTAVIDLFHDASLVPVISPVSRTVSGEIYNVNADLAASELAVALKADHCIFISDVGGVLLNNEIRHEIRSAEIEALIAEGYITGGMVPKVRSAREAVYRGVYKIHICTWYGPETLTNELTIETSQGTVIY
jgi:acetylglutamate kinase